MQSNLFGNNNWSSAIGHCIQIDLKCENRRNEANEGINALTRISRNGMNDKKSRKCISQCYSCVNLETVL